MSRYRTKFFQIIIPRIFFILGIFLFPSLTQSQDLCGELERFGFISVPFDHQEKSTQEYLSRESRRDNEARLMAENIFEYYLLGGEISKVDSLLHDCMNIEDTELLDMKMQVAAKSKAIKLLKTWGPRSSRFAALVEKNNSVFNLFRHEKTLGKKKAGFDRGSRSIFMKLGDIYYKDWLVIFIHEYVHALDETLRQNVRFFGDIDNVLRIEKIANTQNLNDQAISLEDYDLVYKWCLSSFQRGILAETRAWIVTAMLYLEARNNGKIDKLPWMNETFFDGEQTNEQNWYRNLNIKSSEKIYYKLSPNFTTSYEGIFSIPIFKELTEKISNEIKINPTKFFQFDQNLQDIQLND